MAEKPATLAARYRSLFVIGRGGMGTVEAALAIEPTPSGDASHDAAYRGVVALKRLLPDGARDKRRAEMFLREARLATMLDHPNVVRAYDYGEIDGELFLAMEYVEGQPLSRVLRELAEAGERMPVSVAAYILAEICRGLHAAHELADPSTGLPLQLVHRDVSPQNVMIGYDGHVRLLDFGVAKIESENVTKTGEVKGKTAYMSPEQAMGEALDRRSDLFGVGAILYECIALRRMWGDGTDMEVIRRLALESPPGLETATKDLPKALSELHARLVAREAKDRPATAIEVATAFLDFVADKEAAIEQVRAIMAQHFAEKAAEQRARLTAALTEVAPAQADELRESVVPAMTPTRTQKAQKPVPAASAAPEPAPPAPAKPASTRAVGLAVAGLAVVGLVVWRGAVASDASHAPPPPATVTVTTMTAPVTANAAPPPEPPSAASSTPPPVSAALPAPPAPPRSSALVRAHPTVTPHPTESTPPAVSVTPPPRPKPADVDEHPF